MLFSRCAGVAAVLLMLLSIPSAYACDLQAATNNTRAAGYVEDVLICLTSMPDGYTVDSAIEDDNFNRVNAEREKRGLTPLQLRRDLKVPARWHSMDMAANKYFSHEEKSKRTHSDRISLLDRTLIYSVASENIALVRGDNIKGAERQMLHTGLMESDSHREAILSDEVTHMATGVVRHGDGVWLTQIFVNQMGEFSSPVPVRVGASESLPLKINFPGWTPGGYEAHQEEDSTLLLSLIHI